MQVRVVAAASLLVVGSAGCAADVPSGKSWRVDTSAWAGSPECAENPCALDAYETRDFTRQAARADVLVEGDQVQVHCFVPTPTAVRDPQGRDAYRWYLLSVNDSLLWAPDLALTGEADLREPADEGEHLATGLRLCHSAVPGR